MHSALGGAYWHVCSTFSGRKKTNKTCCFSCYFELTLPWPNFQRKTQGIVLTKSIMRTASVNFGTQINHRRLFLSLKEMSCYLPPSLNHLLPLLLLPCPWGGFATRPLPAASSQQQKHCLLLFYFSPLLHLCGAITLPYSAYDPEAMGGGTHWPRMIMLLHRA